MSAILELESIRKEFSGGYVAVEDLNLSVREGEFLTILGPSGCGKSTTLRMIGGFEYPTLGSVLIDGHDVTDRPSNRRPVSMVFQDYALFPHLTAEQNIAFGLRLSKTSRGEIRKRVAEALKTIHLSHKANLKPHELSIGQRQRVALMRALVLRPRLVLLDEPMSALDLKLREAMQVEICQRHRELGVTFIMVTHDQSEALSMSDRVMVMEDGKLVQLDTPAQLYDNPATPYVADFVGSSNLIAAKVLSESNGLVRLKIGHSEISLPAASNRHKAGDDVVVAIRPERISVMGADDKDSSGKTVVTGEFIESLYKGNSAHVLFDIGSDSPLTVSIPLTSSLESSILPRSGQRTMLSLGAASIKIFSVHTQHAESDQ